MSSDVLPLPPFPVLLTSRGRRGRGSIARRMKARVADRDCYRHRHLRRRPVRHWLRSYGRALLLPGYSLFLRGTDEVADFVAGLGLPSFGVNAQRAQTPRRVPVPKGVMEPALCSLSHCLVAQGSSSEVEAYCLERGQRPAVSSRSTANPTHDSLVTNGVLVVDSGASFVISDDLVAPPGLHLLPIEQYNNHN